MLLSISETCTAKCYWLSVNGVLLIMFLLFTLTAFLVLWYQFSMHSFSAYLRIYSHIIKHTTLKVVYCFIFHPPTSSIKDKRSVEYIQQKKIDSLHIPLRLIFVFALDSFWVTYCNEINVLTEYSDMYWPILIHLHD